MNISITTFLTLDILDGGTLWEDLSNYFFFWRRRGREKAQKSIQCCQRLLNQIHNNIWYMVRNQSFFMNEMLSNIRLQEEKSFLTNLKNGGLKNWIENWDTECLPLAQIKEFAKKLDKIIRCLFGSKSQQSIQWIERISDIIQVLRKKLRAIRQKKIILYLKLVFETYTNFVEENKQLLPTQVPTIESFQQPPQNFHQAKNNEINKRLKAITSSKFQLPDNQNFCCSSVFFKNKPLPELNDRKKYIIMELKDLIMKGQAEKFICSGLNCEYGAYILVGVDKNTKKIIGEIFTETEKQQYRGIIQKAMKNVWPEKMKGYDISFIPVISEKFDHQAGRYVLRIALKKSNSLISFYTHSKRQSYHSIFILYKLKNQTYEQVSGPAIYSLMQSFSGNKGITPHYGSKCKKSEEGNFLYEKEQIQEKEEKIQEKIEKKLEVKEVFKYQSLLTVNSQKKQNLILRLLQKMKLNKMIFQARKPFKNYQINTAKVVYFISHDDKFNLIDKKRKEIDQGNEVSFFTIYKNLSFEPSESREKKVKKLRQIFKLEFKKDIQVQKRLVPSKKTQPMFKLFLLFDSNEQAIFAYICLDSLGIRATITKDSQIVGDFV